MTAPATFAGGADYLSVSPIAVRRLHQLRIDYAKTEKRLAKKKDGIPNR